MIKVKNLTVKYNNSIVLDKLDWVVLPNSYNFLVGGNGSGKTTLIRCILGLEQLSSGKILYEDSPINKEIVAANFGYVPQYSSIQKDFPMTVEELIRLECSLSKHTCHLNPAEHLKEIGIQKLLNKKLGDLSGGEFQKVLIAKGLISEPKVLLLDEPNNNLDKKSRDFVYSLLLDWWKSKNTTIIHITHDAHEINDTGVNVFNLINGKIDKHD